MAYEGIKDRLNIGSGISTFDVSLGIALDEATRWLIMEIGVYDGAFTTVSGNTVPEDISFDYAAGIYTRRWTPESAEEDWKGLADTKLVRYILVTYDQVTDLGQQLQAAQVSQTEAGAGLTTAQEVKLAGVDTDKVTADTSKVDGEITNLLKAGALTDAQKLKLEGADTDKIIEDITKITAEVIAIPINSAKVIAETTLLDNKITHSGFSF